MRLRFPRSGRLSKRTEFLAVQSTGKKVHTKYFLVLVREGGSGRVGITATKRIGNAVTRNRLKRLIREFIRQSRSEAGSWVPADRDLVIVVKSAAVGRALAELSDDLMRQQHRVATC